MENIKKSKQDVKEIFAQCGTCSQTFAHLLNREFGHPDVDAEKALDPLAGGIANHGHQCGMLWGAALAIGAEANRRYPDRDQALAMSIAASQVIVDSFVNRTGTVNCKDIIGHNLKSIFGMAGFMLKAMMKGMKNSQCFNLAEDWAPEAIDAGIEGLNNKDMQLNQKPVSCASEVVKRLGGTDQESLMVSGFAGGIGLSGKACGALAAAIWYHSLQWCKANPNKRPAMFNNPIAKKLVKAFRNETGSCIDCEKITGCRFKDINEHSKYIQNGGCEKLIKTLVQTSV